MKPENQINHLWKAKLLLILTFISFNCVAQPLAERNFSFDNPPGNQFSEQEKQQQLEAGLKIRSGILEAIKSGESGYTIPDGDYRFKQDQDGYAILLEDVHYTADRPFVIKGHDVTFWICLKDGPCGVDGNHGLAMINCSHILVDGIKFDSDPLGNIEGRVTQIDFDNNRIEIEVSEGSNYGERFLQMHSQSRIIPFNADGKNIAPLYTINREWGPGNYWLDSLYFSDKPRRLWMEFRNNLLLETIRDPEWIEVYGADGIIEVGDGIGIVYSTGMILNLTQCREITIKNVDCYIAKGSL